MIRFRKVYIIIFFSYMVLEKSKSKLTRLTNSLNKKVSSVKDYFRDKVTGIIKKSKTDEYNNFYKNFYNVSDYFSKNGKNIPDEEKDILLKYVIQNDPRFFVQNIDLFIDNGYGLGKDEAIVFISNLNYSYSIKKILEYISRFGGLDMEVLKSILQFKRELFFEYLKSDYDFFPLITREFLIEYIFTYKLSEKEKELIFKYNNKIEKTFFDLDLLKKSSFELIASNKVLFEENGLRFDYEMAGILYGKYHRQEAFEICKISNFEKFKVILGDERYDKLCKLFENRIKNVYVFLQEIVKNYDIKRFEDVKNIISKITGKNDFYSIDDTKELIFSFYKDNFEVFERYFINDTVKYQTIKDMNYGNISKICEFLSNKANLSMEIAKIIFGDSKKDLEYYLNSDYNIFSPFTKEFLTPFLSDSCEWVLIYNNKLDKSVFDKELFDRLSLYIKIKYLNLFGANGIYLGLEQGKEYIEMRGIEDFLLNLNIFKLTSLEKFDLIINHIKYFINKVNLVNIDNLRNFISTSEGGEMFELILNEKAFYVGVLSFESNLTEAISKIYSFSKNSNESEEILLENMKKLSDFGILWSLKYVIDKDYLQEIFETLEEYKAKGLDIKSINGQLFNDLIDINDFKNRIQILLRCQQTDNIELFGYLVKKENYEDYLKIIEEYKTKGLLLSNAFIWLNKIFSGDVSIFEKYMEVMLKYKDIIVFINGNILNILFKEDNLENFKTKLNKLKEIKDYLNNDEIAIIVINSLNDLIINYSPINLLKFNVNGSDYFKVIKYLYETKIKDFGYTNENWDLILLVCSKIEADETDLISNEIKEHIKELINQNKDDIYNKIKLLYLDILKNKSINENIDVLTEIIETNGLGNLSQIETLIDFMGNLKNLLIGKKSYYATRDISEFSLEFGLNLIEQLKLIEEKTKKLSNQEKTHFYAVSMDILKISKEVFLDYLLIFNKLNETQMKYFLKELYTLHNVLFSFSKEDIIDFKSNITQKLLNELDNGNIEEKLEQNKIQIQERITKIAKDKFGILKIPENFNEEQIENIKQFSIYYTNINERNDEKIKMIGIVLGLKLNGLWEKFRSGKNINFDELFELETANFAKSYKEKLKELFNNVFTIDGIQREVSSIMIGSAETIDQKLINIKTHIKEQLTDKDAYDEETYKIFELYKKYGGKLGKALSLKFQNFLKGAEIDEESKKILQELGDINSQEKLLEIQERVDLVKGVVGIILDVDKLGLDEDLISLSELLIPNQEIINIFIKLGEDFSNDSGVIALSQDVGYLFDLITKNRDKLTHEEFAKAKKYLEEIKLKLDNLYKYLFTLEEIFKNKFCEKDKKSKEGIKKELLLKSIYAGIGDDIPKLPILKARLESLKDEILKGQSVELGNIEMMTTFTSDLSTVIENIRGCLGCQKKEINNDTNLRFTAPNEFFIISTKIGNKKSFADQPVTLLESDKGSVFVFDTLRGEVKTPDIIVAHILVVLKKLKQLNRKDISIFLPPNSFGGVGITSEYILKKLKEEFDGNISIQDKEIFDIKIQKQDYYDPHYEWGNIREKKDKVVSGIKIKLL